jgi:UDP-glucuronate decarboxylase
MYLAAQRSMKRVLVTGGAGFLGSHLCERLLRDGCHVVSLDSLETGSAANLRSMIEDDRFQAIEGDVASIQLDLEVDEIFHLACPASPPHYQRDPVRTIRTSVVGTLRMLELADRCGARLLLSSTSEVYGDPELHPQSENYWGHVNPIGPRACYDEGKRCAEALVVSFARSHGTSCRIARVFNTYGPRMLADDGRVVSNFVCQALHDEPITVYGDGRQTRSFCFVTDTVEGLIRLMRCPVDPGPVNLGNPVELDIRELAELVIHLTGSGSTIVRKPLPEDDPVRRRPDISRARRLLEWSPTVDLRAGLKQTIDYFRASMRSDAATTARLRQVGSDAL